MGIAVSVPHTYEPALTHEHAPLPGWCPAGDWTPTHNDVYRKLGSVFPNLVHRLYEAIGADTDGTSVRLIGADGKPVMQTVERKGKQKQEVVCVRKEWTDRTDQQWAEELDCSVNSIQNALDVLTDPRWGLTLRRTDPRDKRKRQYRNDNAALKAFNVAKAKKQLEADAREAAAKLAAKMAEVEAEADEDERDDDSASASVSSRPTSPLFRTVLPAEPLVLLAGQMSKPFVLSPKLAVQVSNNDGRGAKVIIDIAGRGAVAVSARFLSDGKIDFAISDMPEGAQQTEAESPQFTGETFTQNQQVRSDFAPESTAAAPASDAAFERFVSTIGSLERRTGTSPSIPLCGKLYARLEAGAAVEEFHVLWKNRKCDQRLNSYKPVAAIVDDAIANVARAKRSPAASSSPSTAASASAAAESLNQQLINEFDYDAFKDKALDDAMNNLEPHEHEALKQACTKQLAASDPKWGLLTRDQRWMRVDAAIRAKIRDQLKLPTFREFVASRQREVRQ